MNGAAGAWRARDLARRLGIAWSILWRVLALFVVWGAALEPLIVPIPALLRGEAEGQSPLIRLAMEVAALATLLLASWFMARVIDRRAPARLGLGRAHAIPDLLFGMIAGAAWLGLSLAIAAAGRWLAREPDAHLSGSVLVVMAISTALNVLTQQLLLCGYVFAVLRGRTCLPMSLLVSSALFAGYHASALHGAWLAALNVFGAGALFCLARERTGRVWLGSGIHFAWNFLLGPVLGLTVSRNPGLRSGSHLLRLRGPAIACGGAFGIEGGLIVTATTLATIGALTAARHAVGKRSPEVADAGRRAS
jgi:membrane protease YdiL (CAAX protease family)